MDIGTLHRPDDVQNDAGSVRLLTADGHRVPHGEFAFTGDADAIRELYRRMVLVRRMDTEAFALQRTGELALWPPALGQEAALVGSSSALGPNDIVYPTYRECAVGWLLGVPLANLLGVWRGTTYGGWDPSRFGPMSIVIGSHPLHAVGHAMGLLFDHRTATGDASSDAAVLTYFGDGATSQGDVMEAFAFAAVNHAPVVFFCQNNQYAISLPFEKQSAVSPSQRAAGFGFPGVKVDGNDVLACQAVTARALQWAREGHGPVLIEAVTYRMGPHTTSDDAGRYRDDAEVERWRGRDPIDRVRTLLEATGTPQEFFTDLATSADELAAELRRVATSLPDPDLADCFDQVFVETPPELLAQRDEYLAWREQYEGEGA